MGVKHPVRAAMDAAIRTVVLPELRRRGFTGRPPHLRRKTPERIDLLTFQFAQSGGSFVVEIGSCPAHGYDASYALIPPDKVTAWDLRERLRLGSSDRGDHWFQYGLRMYEDGHDIVRPEAHYRWIAMRVARLLDVQAEPFWERGEIRSPDEELAPER